MEGVYLTATHKEKPRNIMIGYSLRYATRFVQLFSPPLSQ